MIRVQPAPEPPDFDARVRQPGLRAIAELVGERPPRQAGRRCRPVAASRDAIPPDKFPPFWRQCLDELLTRYGRVCAYLALYISRGTGARSVDHFVAKSTRWDLVYEWRNYRLACDLLNSRKGAVADVLDPFEIEDDWFGLELVAFQVLPRVGLPADVAERVGHTILRLGLNDPECCNARTEYADDYWHGHVTFDYLSRHAPFVARELRRQNRVRPEDA